MGHRAQCRQGLQACRIGRSVTRAPSFLSSTVRLRQASLIFKSFSRSLSQQLNWKALEFIGICMRFMYSEWCSRESSFYGCEVLGVPPPVRPPSHHRPLHTPPRLTSNQHQLFAKNIRQHQDFLLKLDYFSYSSACGRAWVTTNWFRTSNRVVWVYVRAPAAAAAMASAACYQDPPQHHHHLHVFPLSFILQGISKGNGYKILL